MESNAATLMREMCIPEAIITQVLKITQKEEEAINLALELMENPSPVPENPKESPKEKPKQAPPVNLVTFTI
jgi:hypothetical protein